MSALAGLPISVKDLFDIEGVTTLAGSTALADRPPAARDAPAIARLRAAGAVILGTTNMTEFAFGGLGLNPHYGTPLNPFDRARRRIPGGSSSGAAVSVTDGMAAVAIGTDTAGSVRLPAALCGIVGFKPTARRVPTEAVVPLAKTLDSVGVLAPTVAWCRRVDEVLSGEQVEPYSVALEGLRFAVPKTLMLDGIDSDVASAFSRALSRLSRAGCRITEITLGEIADIIQINSRGGFPIAEAYAWHHELLARKRGEYDPIIAKRLATGAAISAKDYIVLREARADIIGRAAKATREFDAVLSPTVAVIAPLIDDVQDEAAWLTTNRLVIRNTGIANFLDRCAISLPCHPPGCAPVGLMLMGEAMADHRLLGIAQTVEALLAKEA